MQARRQAEPRNALRYLDAAEHAPGSTGDATWLAKLHLSRAEALLDLGKDADAEKVLEKLPPQDSLPHELAARSLMDQAELSNRRGQTDKARSLLAQANDIASRDPAGSVLASIELKRGLLLDDFDQADAAYHHSLEIAQRNGDDWIAAQALGNIGYIRMDHFRYDEAIPWFEAADRSAGKIPSKLIHEENLGNLGWCYFRLGQSDRALEELEKALQMAKEIHRAADQQLWLGDIGAVYYSIGSYANAITDYSQAAEIARQLGKEADAARWLANIARAYIDQHNWDEAEKYARIARSAKPNDALAPYLELNEGLIATARGRTKDAETTLQTALKLARRTHQPNVAWQAHSSLAELYRPRSAALAQREYAAAVAVLDREWLALSRNDSKITFRNYQTSFYQDYVGFLAEQGQKEKALEAAEGSRARLLVQKLDGRTSALPPFHVADALRAARETGAVLLSYWLAPGRSYLWAVTAKGVSQFALPGEAGINAMIEQHRRSIENLEDPLKSGGIAARELYKILLGPVQPLLRPASHVVIVPDGRLHEINFETLVAEAPAPHYWVEDAVVELAPSLGVLRVQHAPLARTPRLLIIGDPLPADPEFPPLPHLKTEIREIASGFPAADRAIYSGPDANADRFREANPAAFTAIHFAAHATANEESPLNSAIILSPHDGRYKLYASQVAGLHLDPELVTISACRSAGAKAYSGEGLIGFAWAFLDAGAHNVVAGIWNVDDAAAPRLMQQFYASWRGNRDPATALHDAELQLMRSGGAFRKPYYWGPFEVFTRELKIQNITRAISRRAAVPASD